MNTEKSRKVGNKDFRITMLVVLIIGAFAFLTSGCGGGGGGGGVAVSTDIGYHVTGSASYNTATAKIYCDQSGVTMTIDWDNGGGYGTAQDCPTSSTPYSVGYNISSEQQKNINIKFYRNSEELTSGKYQKDIRVTVAPHTSPGDDTDNSLPAIDAIAVTDFSNLREGKNVQVSCTINGNAVTGMEYVILYGDGATDRSSVCTFAHPYANLSGTAVNFTIQITVVKDSSEGVPGFKNITVRKNDVANVEPPSLDDRYNEWTVTNAYEWNIINPTNGHGYTFRGYSPDTACTSEWYYTTLNSTGVKIKDVVSNSSSDFTLTLDFSGSSYQDGNIGIVFYCKINSSPGKERTVWYYIDKTPNAKPKVTGYPRYTDKAVVSYNVEIEDSCRLMRSINSTTYVEARPAQDMYSAVVNSFTESLTLPSEKSYAIRYKCIDNGKNESNIALINIDYGVNSDGGICGDGSCDNGETNATCPTDCGNDVDNTGTPPAYSFYTDTAATMVAYDSVMGTGFFYIEGGRLYRKDIPSGNQTGSWVISSSSISGLPAVLNNVVGMAVGDGRLFLADATLQLIFAIKINTTSSLTYDYIIGSGMNIAGLGGIDYFNGKLYVTNSENHRALAFNTSNGSNANLSLSPSSGVVGIAGSGIGQLSDGLCDIAVDGGRSTIYIADCGNHAIKAYDLNGAFLREKTGLPMTESLKARNISGLDSLLVFTDTATKRIYGYTDTGSDITWVWTLSSTSQNGNFQYPTSVSWNSSTSPNSNGQLIVADRVMGKVQVFTPQ